MSLSFRRTAVEIPEDILVGILVRLPGRSLMRFKCVSKLWSSLISSRYFTDLFFKFSSSTKPERVFMYVNDCMLFSSSFSNLDLDATDSFPQLNPDLTFPESMECLDIVNVLRGLMCFIVGVEIRIINLTTRQVMSLPLVKSNMLLEGDDYYYTRNYFGYDPINDEYKVLNTIAPINNPINKIKEGRTVFETQILVLGAGASWRNTKSLTSPPPSHSPEDQRISINGVLYYEAWSHEERDVLMSFDFNSEEFVLIEYPIIEFDIIEFDVSLMNYQDQVAIFNGSCLNTKCILDLWVLEDAKKSIWSCKSFVLPCHQFRQSLDIDYLLIRGTSCSGEIMLSERYVSTTNKTITHVIYDLVRHCITRGFVMKPPLPFSIYETNLWDVVESIMYLEA